MVKKLLKLLGLFNGKKERKESRVGILKEASQLGNGDGATYDSDTARSPSDVSRHDYGAASVPAAARSPDDKTPTVTTTATPPLPKKSYWDETAKKLQREDPNAYKALKELMKHPSPDARICHGVMSELIDTQKSLGGDGQRRSFFKVTSEETKHRLYLETYKRLRQIFVDYALTIDTLDQDCADIPWAGLDYIKNAYILELEQSRELLAGVARNAMMIAGYAGVEVIYKKDSKTNLNPAFETSLIDLYTSILVYRVKAASHCKKLAKRVFRGPLRRLLSRKSDIEQECTDWGAMQQTIDEKHAVCKRYPKIFDSPDPQVAGTSLQSILETFGKRRAGAVKEFKAEEKATQEPPPYTEPSAIPQPISIWEQTLANL